ncbi:MAG: PAS domain S-box protein [Proteobacteria bacterium]|nr:PAS domain S-box protein [Pseudomonadota bacterium]
MLVAIISISIPAFSSSIKTLYFYTAPSLIVSVPLLLMRGGNDALLAAAIIVFSAMALRSGKDFYNTLIDSFTARFQAQEMAENIKQLDHDKSETEQRLLLHREQSPVGIIEWNTDFEIIEWNPAAQKIFGFSEEEVKGCHITERILPESARPAINEIWAVLLANKGGTYSLNENKTKDGRVIMCEWHNTPLVDNNGNVIAVTSLVEDVTSRQRDEDNLRHSQKMDAIGKLTGGIAHDFNNMLGVILGYSRLLKESAVGNNPRLIKYSDQIITAGERAKKLTTKLLEFSRKAPSSAETTDINKLLEGMRDMLQKTLTPRIKLEMNLQENLWPVWLDPTRFEDAILNMSINAMHAMPDGGRLTLTSENVQPVDKDIHNMDINAGDYVLLSLEDTGTGMSQEVQSRIFEPFFTTKGTEGTGLGLSQVYGFLQQSQCGIDIESEQGHGTRVIIYIPRYHENEKEKLEKCSTELVDLPSGEETILVVDDETALLEYVEEILTTYDYTVLCAENAEQALEILQSNSVDLMFSDVIMPGKDGYQLATEVAKLYPKIKIQMASGFSDDLNLSLANEKLHQQRLHKPYTLEQILLRVRKLLDEDKVK